jgi:putative ABC transport system substrate-binding protein
MRVVRKSLFGCALCAVFFVVCSFASAQQREKVYRVGYLSSGKPWASTDPGLDAFRQRLRQLAYVEGRNLVMEYRYGELDPARLLAVAKELTNLQLDVILTSPDEPAIRAAQSVTATIPVVMPGIVVDPMASTFWGDLQRAPLVASLARPGGNFTGLTNLDSELHGKRLELLKEGFPHVSRVALLWPRAQQQKQTLKEIEAVREALHIKIQSLAAGTLEDFERAFTTISRESPDALLVARSQVILNRREQIIGLAIEKRLPTIFAASLFVEDGGLMSYGADTADLYRRAATFVDKILKGSKPGDLPIERPVKFDFVVNLKTTKQIGSTIPPNVLARADRVIR